MISAHANAEREGIYRAVNILQDEEHTLQVCVAQNARSTCPPTGSDPQDHNDY